MPEVKIQTIYLNLPGFVQSVMQGSVNGSRQELKQLVCINCHHEDPLLENLNDLPPHTREIVGKIQGDPGVCLSLETDRHRSLHSTTVI